MKGWNSFENVFEEIVCDFDDGTWATSADNVALDVALKIFQHSEPAIIKEDLEIDWVRYGFHYDENGDRSTAWVNMKNPENKGSKKIYKVDINEVLRRTKLLINTPQ